MRVRGYREATEDASKAGELMRNEQEIRAAIDVKRSAQKVEHAKIAAFPDTFDLLVAIDTVKVLEAEILALKWVLGE